MLQVQEMEIPQILAAVSELQKTEAAAIPLTYIICQKRHMTRLFPAQQGAGDRNGNVLPGAPLTDLQTASMQPILNQALLALSSDIHSPLNVLGRVERVP